jgi:hypothetical protein
MQRRRSHRRRIDSRFPSSQAALLSLPPDTPNSSTDNSSSVIVHTLIRFCHIFVIQSFCRIRFSLSQLIILVECRLLTFGY